MSKKKDDLMKNKIIWGLKQLLPLTYHTVYTENNKKFATIWKMWFGKCYKIEKWQII